MTTTTTGCSRERLNSYSNGRSCGVSGSGNGKSGESAIISHTSGSVSRLATFQSKERI